MTILLAICNYNASTHLQTVFDSIKENRKNLKEDLKVKVSVVDNASKDGSQTILKRFQDEGLIDTLVLSEANVGKAIAIDRLVFEAGKNGLKDDDLVFSLDSDISLIADDFFTKLDDIWTKVAGKVSCIVCQQLGNSLFKRKMNWRNSGKGFDYFADPYGEGIAGGAIIVPFRHWKMVNGYDTSRGLYGGNDGQMMLNLHRMLNMPVCVIRDLTVFHPYEENLNYIVWKKEAHKQQMSHQKCIFSKGFYD